MSSFLSKMTKKSGCGATEYVTSHVSSATPQRLLDSRRSSWYNADVQERMLRRGRFGGGEGGMARERSQDDFFHLLHDIASQTLGDDASEARQALLRQTAEELWQVTQASVQAEDEPALLP